MSEFSIITLPQPAPDLDTLAEYSSRLKALRLRSLRQDPDNFVSVYENEVGQPQEFWLKRISDPRAIHQVVVRSSPTCIHQEDSSILMQGKWVGFVVIIAPDWDKLDMTSHGPPEYVMAALYIDPEFRGLGLGRRLVQATIDTVKKDHPAMKETHRSCITSVRHGNDHALALYKKMGFQVVEMNAHIESEGRICPATTLRLDV